MHGSEKKINEVIGSKKVSIFLFFIFLVNPVSVCTHTHAHTSK